MGYNTIEETKGHKGPKKEAKQFWALSRLDSRWRRYSCRHLGYLDFNTTHFKSMLSCDTWSHVSIILLCKNGNPVLHDQQILFSRVIKLQYFRLIPIPLTAFLSICRLSDPNSSANCSLKVHTLLRRNTTSGGVKPPQLSSEDVH